MMKFQFGKLVATRAVADRMQADKTFEKFVYSSLGKYIDGDWGSIDDSDKALNDNAVKTRESRIIATYIDQSNTMIWIITEWNRSVTTILFPYGYILTDY